MTVQLNEYETASYFYSIKPQLDIGLFVDLADFSCFSLFLPVLACCDHKIVLF